MKTQTARALLAGMVMAGLSGCASGYANGEAAPFNKTQEIQCEVYGLHTLASDAPDYLSALHGYGDETGRRSVLLN